MNVKTSLAIISIAAAPMASCTKKTAQSFKPQSEYVMKDAVSNMASYNEFIYPKNYYGIGGAKFMQNIKNINKEIMNADKSVIAYDDYGNTRETFSRQGQKLYTVTKDSEGNLCEYSIISYKNGKKSKEDIYNDRGMLVETHKYNNDGTALVRNFDDDGNIQFEDLYKTEIRHGEEYVPTECGYCFE